MSSTNTSTGLPPELAAALDEALRNAMTGNQDPEAMLQACDEQDRLREELRQKVGDLNVRDLSTLLGGSGGNLKELAKEPKDLKEPIKEPKDHKDIKDHKEPKDHKDIADQKAHKDPKDHKDQKEQKDHKDPKDTKDPKDQKDPKDPKEQKDQKDHKEPKDHKDQKDIKDRKEHIKEPLKEPKERVDTLAKASGEGGPESAAGSTELDALIQRISGLEQAVQELKQTEGKKK